MYNNPLDQPEDNPRHPMPNPLGKVMLINIGIMAVFLTLTALSDTTRTEVPMSNLIVDAMLIIFQIAVNVVIGVLLLFTRKKHVGKAMLLSGLLLAMFGFVTCLGKAAVM